MRIVITGGTGFVGQAVAELYIKGGHQVYVTGHEAPVPGSEYLGRDFTTIDWPTLSPMGRGIDILNHQAAITDPQHPDADEIFRVNFYQTIDLFQKAAFYGVKRIVYASSAAVYGRTPPPFKEDGPFDPRTPYALAKLALDKTAPAVLPPGVSVIGLRYSNVYGPGEGHKGKLASMVRQIGLQMMKGQRPKLYPHGEQRRDFVHVDDVARANVLASRVVGREIFNVGFGTTYTFNEIVDLWNKTLGSRFAPEWIDNPFGGTYQDMTQLDITKSRMMGWTPKIPMIDAIPEYRHQLKAMHGRRGNW